MRSNSIIQRRMHNFGGGGGGFILKIVNGSCMCGLQI